MNKILIDEAAVKLVLGALKQIDDAMPFPVAKLAQAALREALASEAIEQPERSDNLISGLSDYLEGERYEQPAQPQPVAIEHCIWARNGNTPCPHTSPPAQRKPLTDEEIWKVWCSRPEILEGKDNSMEAEFVAAVRRVLAAHGIKENT